RPALAPEVRRRLGAVDRGQHRGELLDARGDAPVHLADPEDRVAGTARLDGPGDVAGLLCVDADAAGDAADDPSPADYAGDPLLVDAVLERDDEAARRQVLADQRRRPDRVVRLRADEADLDWLLEEALDFVEVERPRVDEVLALRALEAQSLA